MRTRRPGPQDAAPRAFRKGQTPPLPHRLRFREGGRRSPPDSLRFPRLTSRKRYHRLAALRRRPRHDLAPHPTVEVTAMIVGASIPACPSVPLWLHHRPRDAGATPAQLLALTGACRARHCACDALPAALHAPHNADAGLPPRYNAPVQLLTPRGRPPAAHRRGRSPLIHPRATAPMGRRWDASVPEADQKAGVPGRHHEV
jgi:hypothetical protein